MSNPLTSPSPTLSRTTPHPWVIGGALLLAAVVVEVVGGILGPASALAHDVLLAAAVIVFALGMRGTGSVTAREPLGTIALVALALSFPLVWVLNALIVPADAPLAVFALTAQLTRVVQLALALVAVVRIGRTGVVPQPWNWAPAWALGAVVLSAAVQAAASVIVTQDVQAIFAVLVAVDAVIRVSALVGLGVLAIVLGDRATRSSSAPPANA